MKFNNIYSIKSIISIFTVLFMFCLISCSDDSLIPESEKEGSPIPVKIFLSAPEAETQVSSRVSNENNIQDFYLFVFNSSGTLNFKKYYTATDLITAPNVQGVITTLDDNYVVETLKTGDSYIYAVANVNSDYYQGLKDDLDEFEVGTNCMTDFVNLKLENAKQSLERTADTYMLMSGTCSENEDGTFTIAEGKDIKTIHLRRIDSKITFKFSNGGKCETFKATRWYIENAPIYSYLIEQPAGTGTNCTWDASVNLKTDENPGDFFTTYNEVEGDLKEVLNNTFTFYMPENRKNGDSDAITSYEHRELQIKNEDRKNGAFRYAPQTGTYVVVHGIYEGKADHTGFGEKNQDVTANVTYKIHLGYVRNNPDDFFSKRNTQYTYNVTVNGVDYIVLEVETSGGEGDPTEKAPGATGEVVFNNETDVFNLDSHYEQILLTFNKNNLINRNKEDFQCVVSTPFTQFGVSRKVDLDWVKVVKNSDASTDFQAFPGTDSDQLQSVNDMLTDLYYASHPNETVGKPEDKDYTGFFTNDVVTYTCFVNEYYYESVPDGSLLSVDRTVPLWKYFVNQANRKMYIVCHTDLSDDEESSIVSSEYMISQRSIQTFYNYSDKSLTSLTKAYGIETINETGWLEWGKSGSGQPTNLDYGWDNTKALIPQGATWETLINIADNGYKNVALSVNMNKTTDDRFMVSKEYGGVNDGQQYYMQGMNTDYQKAYIACMQRNRNNNGDNNIDDNEIRWYLAAYNQYVGMYVGEASLSAESRLYYYPETYDPSQNLKHYASSTTSGSGNNATRIIWAEEATTFCSLSQRQGYTSNQPPASWNDWSKNTVHYRCVRNLGTVNEHYDNYVTGPTSKPSSGTTTIDPRYLNFNINSRRDDTSGELNPHTYRPDEMDNKLSGEFEVCFDAHPTSNMEKSITPSTYNYNIKIEERTVTETRPNRYGNNWGNTQYGEWVTTSENATLEDKNEYLVGQETIEEGSWRNNNNSTTRTRTDTRTTIINLNSIVMGTTATGCETIPVEPGEAKWRAPNLREFSLMVVFNLIEQKDVCRTRMGYDNYRKGWFYEGYISMNQNRYDQGDHIRCVRDVQ